MKRYLLIAVMSVLFHCESFSQLYLGLGRNQTFSYRFNDQDVNFSLVNPEDRPLTKSYIENRHYNFWTPYIGYRKVDKKNYHDMRISFTGSGAKSLLDKQDFEYDAIVNELAAFNVVRLGPSRYCEFGAINGLIAGRYGYGRQLSKFFSLNGFGQVEYTYRKKISINWYDAKDDHTLFFKRTYETDFFSKSDENSVWAKSSDINASLGLNGGIHFGKYFALNLEIAQNILPSVRKGGRPNNDKIVYWESNAYFTSMQVSLLTYFSKE